MSCENCSSEKIEYLSNTEFVCTSCGFINNLQEEQIVFLEEKKHNRCQQYELKKTLIIREYMSKLQDKWSNFHLENVQNEIETELSKECPCSDKAIIIGIVLKYASKNSIPCDIILHQEIMGLSSKELGKSLRHIRAGVISEGICNEDIQTFIETYGDTGIVRPLSLMGKGHETTVLLGNHIHSNVSESTVYDTNIRVLDSIIDIFLSKNEQKDKLSKMIYKLYSYLIKTTMREEGETLTSLISTYIVISKYKIVSNTKEFCMKTRLTSVPTLNKVLKKHFKKI